MKGYSFTELAKLVEAAMPRAGGAFSGNVSAPRFIGPLQGNADTATAAGRADKLSTARNITIGSTTKAFDGTGNLSWSLAEIGAINASATVAAANKWATPRALQIGNSSKAVDGTTNVAWSLAEIGAIAKNTPNVLGNPSHGVGFLTSGTIGAPWIAAYFGDAAATGGRVVMGTLGNGGPTYATIGAHSPELNAWSKLAINPAGTAGSEVYIGMFPSASSGSGNLFVGNDIEANYVRIREAIPNDNRYVVNKGYVDSRFAQKLQVASRVDWQNQGVEGAVVGMMAWRNYGNGHVIFDASKSVSPDGTSINGVNAEVPWQGSFPTLMGWNGQSTYGVRVDSARVADAANTANDLTGVVSTQGRDIKIHGKRVVVGVAEENQMFINYGGDYGRVRVQGRAAFDGDVEFGGGVLSVRPDTTNYGNANFEARSSGPGTPRISLHKPGYAAAAFRLEPDGAVTVETADVNTLARFNAGAFFTYSPMGSEPHQLTRRDYVDGAVNNAVTDWNVHRFRGDRPNMNVSIGLGSYYMVPGTVNNPTGGCGHGLKFGSSSYGDGHWTSDIIELHGQGLHYRWSINGGFSGWQKFAFVGMDNAQGEPTRFTSHSSWIGLVANGPNGNSVVSGSLNGEATIGAHTRELNAWRRLVINCDLPSGGGETIISKPHAKYDNDGNLYPIYSTGNKPTPGDIGAVNKAGDIMTGTLKVAQSGSQFGPSADGSLGASPIVSLMNSFIEVVATNNVDSTPASGIVLHNRGVSTSALYYKNENTNQGYFNFKSDDDSYDVRINNSKIYHQGFKPTPADIGAVSKAGDTMTGALSVQNKVIGKAVGNGFNSGSFEAQGDGGSLLPRVGFHQPSQFAGSLTMNSGSMFTFRQQNDSYADVALGRLVLANAAGDTYIKGGGDGATANVANLQLCSWFGVGFSPTIGGTSVPVGENAVWIDVRGGHLYARGLLNADWEVREAGQRVYSPRNKPAPADIGAATEGHSQWRLVAAGDVAVAMANHATGSLRATIDTGINSAHGFVHDAAKYRAVIYTNSIETSNPGACSWGAYGTLRAMSRWYGPHTIQLDIYSFGANMNKGQIYRWEVYEVI